MKSSASVKTGYERIDQNRSFQFFFFFHPDRTSSPDETSHLNGPPPVPGGVSLAHGPAARLAGRWGGLGRVDEWGGCVAVFEVRRVPGERLHLEAMERSGEAGEGFGVPGWVEDLGGCGASVLRFSESRSDCVASWWSGKWALGSAGVLGGS